MNTAFKSTLNRGISELKAQRPLCRNFGVPAQTDSMVIDFGIKMKDVQRGITREECEELFGVAAAVKMNFIPQMLSAIAIDDAGQVLDYCRENKVSEVKKHTRVLNACITERADKLRSSYGENYEAFCEYRHRYFKEVISLRRQMNEEAETLCAQQLPNHKHQYIAGKVLSTIMIIKFVENYDREMDKLIASKVGDYVKTNGDGYQTLILAMCISIGEDFGYKLEPNQRMAELVKEMADKAWHLSDTILDEETKQGI